MSIYCKVWDAQSKDLGLEEIYRWGNAVQGVVNNVHIE